MISVFQKSSLNTTQVQSQQDESYIPMVSISSCVSTVEGDAYIPMSPISIPDTNSKVKASKTLSSLMCQPGEFPPPPIHRHLKPCLRRGKRDSGLNVLKLAHKVLRPIGVIFWGFAKNRQLLMQMSDLCLHFRPY